MTSHEWAESTILCPTKEEFSKGHLGRRGEGSSATPNEKGTVVGGPIGECRRRKI